MTPPRRPLSAVALSVTGAGTVAAVAVLAGCSGGITAERATGGYVQGDYGITVAQPEDRDDAPDVGGETLDGDPVSLDDYAGKTVVLNIWGSWCGPCRDEADELVAAEQQLRGDGVVFLGIDIRDLDDNARAFERSYGITWPSIVDQDSSELLGFRDTSLPAPESPPTTYVVDPQGRLGARIATADLTTQTLVDVVDEVRDG
jgi:thiol-disulfide isomerase/thioredoxin